MQEHPYLLFSNEESAQLNERLLNGQRSKIFLETAIHQCEGILDPHSANFFDYHNRKNNYWHSRKGCFIIPGRLITLALTGWLCQNHAYILAAKECIFVLIRENIIDNLGRYKTWRRNSDHDAGKLFAMLGILYDLLYIYLDKSEREELLSFCKESLEISIEYYSRARMFSDNNRGNRYFAGRSILGCAIMHDCQDYPFAKNCAESGPLAVEKGLRLAFGKDGEPFEGASYGTSNIEFLFLTAFILKRQGLRDCTGDRRFIEIGQYILYETVILNHNSTSNGWINNLNDASKVIAPDALYISSYLSQNPHTLWLWDTYALNKSNPKSCLNPDFLPDDFKDAPWKLLFPDDKIHKALKPNEKEIQTSKFFHDRGIASFRNGWEEESLHATIFCGRNGISSHRQADQGQITFYGLGEEFLIDTGYVTPNQKNCHKNIHGAHAEAHNTILIDGIGQGNYLDEFSGWPQGYFSSCTQSNHLSELTCDLRETYPHRSSLKEASRLFQFYNHTHFPYAIWNDKFNCDNNPHQYDSLLHTLDENDIEIKENLITISGKKYGMDIHYFTNNPNQCVNEKYHTHQRLRITQKAISATFLLILHPWKNQKERFHIKVEFGSIPHIHIKNTDFEATHTLS